MTVSDLFCVFSYAISEFKSLEMGADDAVVEPVATHSMHRTLIALITVLLMMCAAAPTAYAADTPAASHPSHAQSTHPAKQSGSSIENEKLDQKLFATPTAPAKSKKSSDSNGPIVRMLFGLVVVLGAIYGIHWFLKKYGQGKGNGLVTGSTDAIEVMATTPLAPNRSLHLVRVGQEMVLIGATENSISRIGAIDAQQLATQAAGGPPEFQLALQGALSGSSAGRPGGSSQSAGQTFVQRFVQNLQMITAR